MRREEYLDPCVVLERRQERSCLGCNQLRMSRWGGTTKYVCIKGLQKASLDWNEMQRCRKFESENV